MEQSYKKRPPRATTFCTPVLLDMGKLLYKSGKFSYISKFHILISYKLTIYIVMCFYQGTN